MNFAVYMTNLFAFFSYISLLLECPLRTLSLQSSSTKIMHTRMASQFVLVNRYHIRESWIPAYYMDISLAGILRTTSRSESANSFFNYFIHHKLSFVEFWVRFETALEWQRQEELKADNKSIHSTPTLMTSWPMEKQGSMLHT
jgi:hypothetical protein